MDSNIAAPAFVSLVIAGGASIDPVLFGDLMDDWLRYGTPAAVNAAVWLPGPAAAYSAVVDAARHWSVLDDGPGYGVVVSAEPDATTDRKARAAARAMKADQDAITYTVKAEELGVSVAATLITLLVEDNAATPPRVPFVILAWGPQEEAPDEFTAELRSEAEKAGIPVLEIVANGLQEMGPMVPAEVIVEPEQLTLPEPSQGSPDEAQATVAPSASGAVWGLSETLQRCLSWFSFQEAAENARNGADAGDSFPGSMIVQSLRHHCYDASEKDMFEAAMGPVSKPAAPAAPDPTPEPPATRKGKSREPLDKVAVFLSPAGAQKIKEGFQPGIGEIKKAKGRPMSGWVRDHVDPELIPASLLAA